MPTAGIFDEGCNSVPHSLIRPDITRIVVVVPVRNEEDLLPHCLSALDRAATKVDVPVHVQLVLDACTDSSADIAGDGVSTFAVDERNVGAARAVGFSIAGRTCRADTWFATTDADSEVDEDWLASQLVCARAGVEVVVGTVGVRWSEHSKDLAPVYERSYRNHPDPHIHGANLGFRADIYWRTGGFRKLSNGEDVDLVDRFSALGARIEWTATADVTTSDRRIGRAPDGFAAHIRGLELSA